MTWGCSSNQIAVCCLKYMLNSQKLLCLRSHHNILFMGLNISRRRQFSVRRFCGIKGMLSCKAKMFQFALFSFARSRIHVDNWAFFYRTSVFSEKQQLRFVSLIQGYKLVSYSMRFKPIPFSGLPTLPKVHFLCASRLVALQSMTLHIFKVSSQLQCFGLFCIFFHFEV